MTPILTILALLGAAPAPAEGAAGARPNVLLISIDDLNDWVGPLRGHPGARTPHIDRLASRGTTFANAHCQAPLCNPSRTSFLTGLRPTTTGVYALEPWFRSDPRWRDHVSLPQHFQRHGYRTITTGKIYHDAYPPAEGRRDGVEFTTWGYHGGYGPRPAQKFVRTPSDIPLMDWGIFPEQDADQEDYKVASWAIDQLREGIPEPFFLAVGLRRPHVPCYASREWFELYPPDGLTLPRVDPRDREDVPRFAWYLHWDLPEPRLAWLEAAGQWGPLVRAYLASISFVDAQVGRLLDALDRAGLADRTVVVLLSDHGWHLGEKGITGKNTLWERSTRVPLIVAGPGVAAGSVCRRPAELLDVYPTLADLCGLPPPEGVEGHSLVPQLRDATSPRAWPAITSHGPGNHTVRTESHRYIRYADGSEELYDHRADPDELRNLAGVPGHEELKRTLAAALPARAEPPLPGSVSRLIELRDGVPYWQGRPIEPDAPIPGMMAGGDRE